jgi:hypothetical protein
MSGEVGDLAYRARALAQAHPLSPMAKRFIDRAVAGERLSQPLPETGTWAAAAILHGYCVRRVEEQDAGMAAGAAYEEIDLDLLDARATAIAADLRVGDPGPHMIGDPDVAFQALDHIIGTEVERRLDRWRDSIEAGAWAELEEYIAWWAVKGYAVRVAESAQRATA